MVDAGENEIEMQPQEAMEDEEYSLYYHVDMVDEGDEFEGGEGDESVGVPVSRGSGLEPAGAQNGTLTRQSTPAFLAYL
jgi:hypothetical protein